ncbi:hypothetical protein [Paraflavitalea pollutisoli]|uniref:hypothetical protein n=1 Tax=Paraflavitalea pollutisoli TaxID=3034143 RepID=UPI0023ECAE1E|nr:hypothetical protein [Paraflavitalea sp. H1-2-19X]
MKMSRYTPGLLMGLGLGLLSTAASAQTNADSTGLPGDQFSLQGALELFKQAASPEAFEQLLNSESSKVNNLDLNEDGKTDYIRVVSKKENDVQVFVLQALVSDKESQDIAVIELEKTGQDNAVLQIVGDEDIYGEETIVEPSDEDQAVLEARPSLLAKGPNLEVLPVDAATGVIVNVWAWPCVRYVYAPSYRIWVSPWSWGVRPAWYRPWRPLAWTVYRPIRYHFRPHYTVVHTRRVVYAPRIYRPMRVTSVTVVNRHQVAVNHYRTTKVNRSVATHGNRHGQVSRKTTTVQGPRGNKVSRTKTTVRRKH